MGPVVHHALRMMASNGNDKYRLSLLWNKSTPLMELTKLKQLA
jgi:hypothetical protein